MDQNKIEYYKDIIKNAVNINNEKFKYVSEFSKLDYQYESTKEEIPKMIYLSNNINRAQCILEIYKIINDFDSSIIIEASIFEFTIIYGLSRNVFDNILPGIYNSKLKDIIVYLKDPNSQIIWKNINLQKIAFLSPQELNPTNWENLKKKQELQEYKKKNMGATDLYKCYKCGERRCQIMQMQTRSADEKMTLFVTCLVCYSTFTK